MDGDVGPVSSGAPAGADDGTGAVLFAMFRSFTDALGDLDGRLAAMESAVRSGPSDLAPRLASLEDSVRELSGLVRARDRADGSVIPAGTGSQRGDVAALAEAVRRRSDVLDERTAGLAGAVESVRALLQAHMEETSHSLGRRAGEAGRRLAGDLGMRMRPKPPATGA